MSPQGRNKRMWAMFSGNMSWIFVIVLSCLATSAMSQITVVGEDQIKIKAQDFFTMPRLLKNLFYLKVECFNSKSNIGMCFNVDVGGVGSKYVVTISYFASYFKVFVHGISGPFSVKYTDLAMEKYHPNQWVSFVVYVRRYKDTYKGVALLNGKEIREAQTASLGKSKAIVSPSMRIGSSTQGAHVLLDGFVRNVFFFGPERFLLQKDIEVNKEKSATLNTEFFSSSTGDSFYEIFCLDNLKKPWDRSDICKMRYSQLAKDCTYFRGNEFIDFEIIWNDHNVPVGGRFKAPTNGTYQQMCEFVYMIRNPSSLGDPATAVMIPMVYAHSGNGFDLFDISSMLTKPLPKAEQNCQRQTRFNWRPSRSNSSESTLQVVLFDKDGKCKSDSKDVTILIHHQSLYVSPTHITMVHLDCLKPTAFTIAESHVVIKLKDFPAHSKLCLYVHYLVSQSMDVSQVISISTETHYADIKQGVQVRKSVRKVYNSHLREFKGYYIRNLDYGCCLAIDTSKKVVCTQDTKQCFHGKESSSRFEIPHHGCLTLKVPDVILEDCVNPYAKPSKIVKWDGSDIVFSEEDQKKGIFMHVFRPKLNLGVSKAKRVQRFRQIVSHQKNPPEICYKKDIRPFGDVEGNITKIYSWGQCSHHCKDTSSCEAWYWNMYSTLCILLSRVGWRNVEVLRRGALWEASKGTLSGDRACVVFKGNSTYEKRAADASVLLLNNKMYFCSYIPQSEKSGCYRHELDRIAVTRIPTSFVEILGGNQYSNMLYGKNKKGQIIHFKSEDNTFTIASERTMKTTKTVKGFVAAKTYNRSQLLDTTLSGEFTAHNETYAITYYGIYREKKRSHLVLWLPETDCEHKVASNPHLALTSCKDISNYCSTVTSGVFTLRRKNGEKETTRCEFESEQEKKSVIDSNPVLLPVDENDRTYRKINLYGGFTMDFQLKLTKAVRTRAQHEVISFYTERLTGTWKVSYSNGAVLAYEITANNEIKLGDRSAKIMPSDNQVEFPTSEGWFKWSKLLRDSTWHYARLRHDGRLEVHHFASDGGGVSYKSLPHYCCSGSGFHTTKHLVLENGKCGATNKVGTQPGQCDPWQGDKPGACCSKTGSDGWCGKSETHCTCSTCANYRNFGTAWNTMLALTMWYPYSPTKATSWNMNKFRLSARLGTGGLKHFQSGDVRVPVNKWVKVRISATQSGTSGFYSITCYINGHKVDGGTPVNVSHEYWNDLTMGSKRYFHTVNGLIRNLDIRKNFQSGV